MKPSIIMLDKIDVSFGNEVVLNNLSLNIKEGEFVTLLGPSGCGKTTTLRIIAGFLTPDSGNVLFGGKRINNVPAHKRHVNTIFQKYALLKYDAFEESGGKMSTILVMLDEKNNGYILNIVHGREGSYTYTKEIIGGNSIVQLGEEEMQALDEALSK